MQTKGRIEEWLEINLFGKQRVAGFVYECEGFDDGDELITSPIDDIYQIGEQLFLDTESGSTYKLGKPAQESVDADSSSD